MALKSFTMILSRLAPYDETDIPPVKKRQLILKSIPPNKVASLVLLAIEFSSVAQIRSLTERITEICGRNSATLSSFVSFYCHSSLYHLKLMAKILCKEFNDRADHRPIIFLVNMKSQDCTTGKSSRDILQSHDYAVERRGNNQSNASLFMV